MTNTEIDGMCDLAGVRCTVCEKTFCTVSYLRRHVRIHTGVRPFQCDICQKTFPGKRSGGGGDDDGGDSVGGGDS